MPMAFFSAKMGLLESVGGPHQLIATDRSVEALFFRILGPRWLGVRGISGTFRAILAISASKNPPLKNVDCPGILRGPIVV